jgi:hypothetical protein
MAFEIQLFYPSPFQDVDPLDNSFFSKYAELKTELEMSEYKMVESVTLKTNLVSEIFIPIALNTAYGTLTK